MITSTVIFHTLHFINITLEIRNICVFLAPLFSSFTTIITFLLTKELKDTRAGLIAAAMIAIVPGYISRSVAGSYDNEGNIFSYLKVCKIMYVFIFSYRYFLYALDLLRMDQICENWQYSMVCIHCTCIFLHGKITI